jgi:hypothetical protein
MPPAAAGVVGLLAAKKARDRMKDASAPPDPGYVAMPMGSGIPESGSPDEMQAAIAADLYRTTSPLRQGLIDRSSQFLAGGLDSSPTMQAYKSGIEQQYGGARENIIGATPSGGALTAALANLESARAHDLAQARGAVEQSELGLANMLATGATGQSLQAYGSASAVQAQRDAANKAREAAMMQSLGMGIGGWLGGKN